VQHALERGYEVVGVCRGKREETRRVQGGGLDSYPFLIAGPPPMAEAVRHALTESGGVDDAPVVVERHGGTDPTSSRPLEPKSQAANPS
jgi:hypothetical protein